MALDRPDDDFTRPDREVPGSDVPAARSDPTEWRSHEEYCEALRVADGKPPEVGDSQEDRSGWDSVDAADRPVIADIHPNPAGLRLAFGEDRNRRVVAVQALGSQDVTFYQGVQGT